MRDKFLVARLFAYLRSFQQSLKFRMKAANEKVVQIFLLGVQALVLLFFLQFSLQIKVGSENLFEISQIKHHPGKLSVKINKLSGEKWSEICYVVLIPSCGQSQPLVQ